MTRVIHSEIGTPRDGEILDPKADPVLSRELITAIYSSSETGQPVDLPLAKDHRNYSSWTPAGWR